ncbi:YugN-like family [Chlamydia abortus]|uniref:YugN family protein n=1 Tax=Paenibacillus residui TaxID=629724 RepID=A0ABW3D5G6_9BACL|nr:MULTISPECIES: YugN family protein [Paenibacillaceae]SHE11597.1 YugN-like family [Chlamydia abortus]
MIIENTGLNGMKSDLAYLDKVTSEVGFVRWQWEYYRATYDYKIEDAKSGETYFLRINTRVEIGKLERPDTILNIEQVYIGRATFPHGLEYTSPIPQAVLDLAKRKLTELKAKLEQ